MKKGWTTTKLIATGALGVLGALIFIPFLVLVRILQMPGLFVMTSAFLIPSILVPGLFIINQFGAAAIGVTVLVILTLPMGFVGPPGFLPGVLLGPTTGFSIDILYFFLKKREKLAAYVIAVAAILIQEIFYISLLWLFSIPGWDKSLKLLVSLPGIGFVFFHGILGGTIGYIILKRIRNTAIVKRIQS
jgi:hypothetical protein